MATFLLTWNPHNSSVRDVLRSWRRFQAGKGAGRADWSCGQTRSIEVGARVFLHRQRVEPRGLVASGWVVRKSYEGPHWDPEKAEQGVTTVYVDWQVDAVVEGFGDDTTPDPLQVHLLTSGPIHDEISWDNMQASGWRVPDAAAREIERLWARHIGGEFVDEMQGEALTALEGEPRALLAKSRSRERWLRDAKIREAVAKSKDGRLRCEVPGCGFCFEERYGSLGEDFAHVHHLDALNKRNKASSTKLGDLAIVCANCHAMIHRHGECRPLAGLLRVP